MHSPSCPLIDALRRHAEKICPLTQLFDEQPQRVQQLSAQLGPIYFDLSKQRLDDAGLDLLYQRAEQANLPAKIAELFAGARVNASEQRAALHWLLRTPVTDVPKALAEQAQAMRDAHAAMQRVCDALLGDQADSLGLVQARDVVNIGIGGSDLGPRLVCEALSAYHTGKVRVHFMTNVDAHANQALLDRLDPAKTLFIIASKSFGTQETRLNALLARRWIASTLASAGQDASLLSRHFLAVSSNVQAAVDFGIAAEHVFPMSDTVGGRFSLWSTVGLSAAIAIGFDNFQALLQGAALADAHYQHQPLRDNLIVRLALFEYWNRNFLGHASRAVIPFDDRLARLPEFLQQLEMESNGKGVGAHGEPLLGETAPVVWGGIGTNVQHAFFQALHQGTQIVPVDLIGVINPDHAHQDNHSALLANLLGQGAALLRGKSFAQAYAECSDQLDPLARSALAKAREFSGNRPTTSFLFDRLTPETLGCFIAMLEHKVHALSVLWGVNAFDQWGVELGKTLANAVLPALQGNVDAATELDVSTQALLQKIQTTRV